MNIKTGDSIIVISGADKGKTGKVAKAYPKEGMVLIEGVNVKKRHQRRQQNRKGQIVDKAMPLKVSKVMLLDSAGKRTRVGHKDIGGKKVRVGRGGKEI
ncbi:MAG: 50S ribosomal protein L24 [Candidatus Taylorbacteria bacterium]|nr:50S ribosomal protein L24 [Candidatus Taylorbacteria bacterium]